MTRKKQNQGRLDKVASALTALIMAQGVAISTNAQSSSSKPADASTNNPVALPEVVVRGQRSNHKPETVDSPRFTEPLRNIPQTITVVPQAVIQEQNATSLRDVLRNVPGISMQAGEGGVPAGDNLSIRGFNARTDVFIDNIRDFGGYSRDPFNLEQVEVVKGPSSANAGRGSTGGSINMVSKTPRLTPFYDGSIGIGTDDYQRLTIDFNQPVKNDLVPGTALRFNGLIHHNDQPGREIVENERLGFAPAVGFGLGTSTRVIFSYFHLEQDNLPDYGIPWVAAGNTNSYLASYTDKLAPVSHSTFYGLRDRDYEEVTTAIPSLRLEHDFSDSLRLRNISRYGYTSRDSIITAPRFADDPGIPGNQFGTAINRQVQSRDQVDTSLATTTDINIDFETGPVGHAVVTGFELIKESSVNNLRTGPVTPLADVFNPDPNQPYTGTLVSNGRTDVDAISAALFAFDTLKIGEQWEVSGGARYDHFDVEFLGTNPANAETALERQDDMFSFRGGLVYKPTSNGSIYAGYGTSFNPSAEGLTLSTGATAANNVGIDPEENRSFEIGTKWDFFDHRLAITTALFRIDKTNARTQDPVDPNDFIVLEGEQRSQGVEFGVQGNLTKEWAIFAGYAYIDSEILESRDPAEIGKEVNNTPRHSANLWTTYQLPLDLEIGIGAQYVGSRYSSNANNRKAPGYVLFDAMLGYQVSDAISLRLNIYNLADREYIDRVGGGHAVPGAGRSAVLTANFNF
ncbi:MAG: TonB-dependent siderophore receptor [Verrucomicrobiota bacterium]|nr:TonB-dependent siderophore receptor [Verrucomicrobiota bacterium]